MQLPIKNKIAYLGLFLSFSLMLAYVEILIPPIFPIPGFKIGLANIGVLFALRLFDAKSAFMISILKATLSALLFGNATVFIFSFFASILSCLIMIVLSKSKLFSFFIISASGAITHNVSQLIICFVIYRSKGVFYFLPFLLLIGLLTGSIIGLVELKCEPYIKKYLIRSV